MTGYNYDEILTATYKASLSNAAYPGDKSNPSGNYRIISSKDRGAQNVNNKILYIEHVNIGKLRNFAVNPSYNTVEYKFSDFVTSLHENFKYLNTELNNISAALSGGTYVPEPTPEPEPTPTPTGDTNYYFYIGTTQITSSSTIGSTVGVGQPGWHLIGNSLTNINVSNKALDTSDQSNVIVLDPTYESATGVDFYIAIPQELNIYDGLGNNLNSNYVSVGTVTLNTHTYKIFKAHDYEFILNIY